MWYAVGKKRFCPNLHGSWQFRICPNEWRNSRRRPQRKNISGRKRTTLKLLIPNLTFSEPIDMGENVWIYMGELCPAYCLYMPQEDGEEKK